MNKKVQRSIKDYEDMLEMPHHVSKTRAQMPLEDRGAQFSPFSAVVGHEAAVKEAARYTDSKKLLDETEKAAIDEKLGEIEGLLSDEPEIELVYFQQDLIKEGGTYLNKVGRVKKLDSFNHEMVFHDDMRVAFGDIYSIEIL